MIAPAFCFCITGVTSRHQLPRQQAQEGRAMPLADHLRLADEGVDRPRPRRQMSEMRLRPDMDAVILRIGERPAVQGHDPHLHARLAEVLFQQRRLLHSIAPPARHLGRAQPPAEPRQIRPRGRPEAIAGHGSTSPSIRLEHRMLTFARR
jgi:hypothetical protein